MGFKQRTAQRDEGRDHSHLRVAGSRGLARHLGCPLSPSASGIVGALDWSWSRCSRVCLHAQRQRTFLIVGLATQLDYCRCWGAGRRRGGSQLVAGSFGCPVGTSHCHQGCIQAPHPHFHIFLTRPAGNSWSGQTLTCSSVTPSQLFSLLLCPVTLSTCQSTAPPSPCQFQGPGLPPALAGWSASWTFALEHSGLCDRSEGPRNLLLLQRTDFVFLLLILANDL